LGLGIDKPTWGKLIASGQSKLATDPHVVLIASAVLFLTVLAINHVGRWLQARWNI
jgi:peptide/nickel transport system permease protein